MAESRRWVTNMKISILFKKQWSSYVIVSLKQEEYHIYIAPLSLQSLYLFILFLFFKIFIQDGRFRIYLQNI